MAMMMAGPRISFSTYTFDDTYPIVNMLPSTHDDVMVNITTADTDNSIVFFVPVTMMVSLKRFI